jgi:hypothetical protein
MKYEFGGLITEQDYRFALSTQRQLELGYLGGFIFLLKGMFYWLMYQDRRFLNKVLNKIKKQR